MFSDFDSARLFLWFLPSLPLLLTNRLLATVVGLSCFLKEQLNVCRVRHLSYIYFGFGGV